MARFFRRRRYCRFTAEGFTEIDYKDLDTLKLMSRNRQDCTEPYNRYQARYQRQLATAINAQDTWPLYPIQILTKFKG